jgi:microcystin degradation protein MlrC
MNVLHEALAQGLTDIVVGPICDPEAVERLISAGIHCVRLRACIRVRA